MMINPPKPTVSGSQRPIRPSTSRVRHAVAFLCIVLLITLVLAACQPQTQEPVVIPTLIMLPSETDTPIPSPSPTPTSTSTHTHTPTPTETATGTPPVIATSLALAATDTPTATATFTRTNTPTLTATATNTNTSTPSRTFTRTVTRTFTPTVTPTPTPTPSPTLTPTATIALPTIQSFGASATSVAPGTTVIFAWAAQGDTARLDQLTVQGAVVQSFPVPVTGQFPVIIPGNFGRQIIYRLAVQRVGQETTLSVVINVLCPIAYFFGDAFAPQTAGCPGGQPSSGAGAFQSFQNGVMVYVNAAVNGTPLNKIYGLTSDNLYVGYVNAWDGTSFRDENEPSGAFDPLQMFNWAYYNTLAPIGGWNSALGWGITSIDTSSRTIQYENGVGGTNPFYIDGPNGAVYRFSGGDNGSWTRIK